ncbi:MAG: YajQ family cyclic di-GMP-binding protein [Planctomycetaceae bacterium]|nr:YajQ family cyclic di-GMP-binding protein [Planctomycetaceae bacterium]
MSESSFDIVAEVDLNEVQNAHQIALKQIGNRYDFKGKIAKLDFNKTEKTVVAHGTDDYVVGQMVDIFKEQLAKRNVSLKSLSETGKEASPSGGVTMKFTIRDTLKQEECKEITKALKASKFKAKASILGETVRVTGKSKDELQEVQEMVRGLNLQAPVKFTNYRSK